jgi:hypothetical protein
MKTASRALLGLVLVLLLPVLVHALEIRLAPSRAAHGFAFAPPDNPGAMTGGGQGVLVTGAAGAEGWPQIDFGWKLHLLDEGKAAHKTRSLHQVWREGFHPQAIEPAPVPLVTKLGAS